MEEATMAKLSTAEITKCLRGMDFPAEKEDIIDYARDNGADEEVLAWMEDMPEEEFASISEVMSAFGEMHGEEEGKRR
jgi:hypothetical protein